MKTYWFGLFFALLFSSCGYCCRDWIPERADDGITVSYLTDNQAAEMRPMIVNEKGE